MSNTLKLMNWSVAKNKHVTRHTHTHIHARARVVHVYSHKFGDKSRGRALLYASANYATGDLFYKKKKKTDGDTPN